MIYNDIGLNLVQEFHDAFGITTPAAPCTPPQPISEAVELIRVAALLHSLAEEVRNAAAIIQSKPLKRLQLIISEVGELADGFANMDLVEILDALGDITYVTDGTYLEYGLATRKIPALREIHRANMSKLGEDGRPIIEASGRVVKGPNYKEPQLTSIVMEPPAIVDGSLEDLQRRFSTLLMFQRAELRVESEVGSGVRRSSASTDLAMAKADRERAQAELNEALAKYLS